jgi:hypothetical protein
LQRELRKRSGNGACFFHVYATQAASRGRIQFHRAGSFHEQFAGFPLCPREGKYWHINFRLAIVAFDGD